MHDQNTIGAADEPRDEIERELTGLVATLLGEVKSLAEVAQAQQQRIDRLELAIAGKEVRS
jgi:hypothetical protein